MNIERFCSGRRRVLGTCNGAVSTLKSGPGRTMTSESGSMTPFLTPIALGVSELLEQHVCTYGANSWSQMTWECNYSLVLGRTS